MFLGCDYQKIEENWYCTEIPRGQIEYSDTFNPKSYLDFSKETVKLIYLSYMSKFPDTYVNVMVEIEYSDGSFVSTSRLVKVDGRIYDNEKDILASRPKYAEVLFK